jgi:hypothetical protein
VLKFRSVKSIVIAPASTGTANKRRTTVTKILQTNRGIRWKLIPGARMLRTVVIKLTAPKIEEAPAT